MALQRRLSSLLGSRFPYSASAVVGPRTFSASAEESSSSEQQQQQRVTTTLQSNGIAHVQLNRPNKLNALDMAMFEAIAETAERLASDKSVRAVILSGQGRGFSAGLDVKSVANPKNNNPLASIRTLLSKRHDNSVSNLAQDVGYLWRSVPAPVIAAIHGVCFGGGLQIALGADMRFCTPDAKLSIMEAKWGLIPDMSASVTLRELLPIDVAKELTFTGRILSGEQAAQYNLVTRCVDDPLQEAEQVALEIVEKSPDAVACAKKLYHKNWVHQSEADALHYEMELQKTLLGSWNQLAASVDNFGVSVPYMSRKNDDGKK
ncbi:Delta(3,5)-Delta(2,4)-dienoyl-CoA isomerase, mitochondrial [Seminavis robusta]|uniref:Delta(3,5)-Delta(2,4)-dienoyl-CoA isomerase, mitochondrial n=1 Tax=Seminavis robusta TaxID=568900 RepID=A0A9N8DX38_9STRA|nr:Delta(3,5)-Delta(2,4)-dienoyl-CoA isomerase, mitochondrial [Seminavis robusta]|eukprot:Sro312_g114460.1 Delta(3,5)-Delta(2,4)-dienoyl-CoA isomerase, mitochondrial (319) ;mRNA; f:6253-7209